MKITDRMATTHSSNNLPCNTEQHGLNITNRDNEPVLAAGCVNGHEALLVLRHAELRKTFSR
jgi:hypothetical protein